MIGGRFEKLGLERYDREGVRGDVMGLYRGDSERREVAGE